MCALGWAAEVGKRENGREGWRDARGVGPYAAQQGACTHRVRVPCTLMSCSFVLGSSEVLLLVHTGTRMSMSVENDRGGVLEAPRVEETSPSTNACASEG